MPLTAHKANELGAVRLDLLLIIQSLNKNGIIQIIGVKCELVNEGTCVIIFA